MEDSPYLEPAMVAIYDRIASRFQFAAPARDLVEITGLREDNAVLDVGAGTGVVAAAARNAVGINGTVVGTDAAFEMIRACPKRNRAHCRGACARTAIPSWNLRCRDRRICRVTF